MATAVDVWTVPARLTSAIATLLSKQIDQDEDSYDPRQALIEQLTAASDSENPSVEVEVNLETGRALFNILCGLCLELDTENAAHEDKLATLEKESFLLQKKVAVLQSQLQRRGPDYQVPDGRRQVNSPVRHTAEEQISPSGKAKTVLSATPVLQYGEPSPSRLETTVTSPPGFSQTDVHDNSSQHYRVSSPSPKGATPLRPLSSSSHTLGSDPISPIQASKVPAFDFNAARASHRSAERLPSPEPFGTSPTNAKKRRRSQSTTSFHSIPSATSRRARSSSVLSDSEMSISTQRSRSLSRDRSSRRERSPFRAGRGRSPGPQSRSPRPRSISRRSRFGPDIERREKKNNNWGRGGRRSRRRALSRSPQAKRRRISRGRQERRDVDVSDIGPSRRRSRSRTRSLRSSSRERRLRYSRSPTPHYHRLEDRRRPPRRSRSPHTSPRYRGDRDAPSSRRWTRDHPPTPRRRNDYERYRDRSPARINPSPLLPREAPEMQRLPRTRDSGNTSTRSWERIMYLPPRPDGTAGKHAVWVRKDNSDASGIANRDRLLSSAPPSVPSTDWAPSQHQVNPRTGGPESRDGITKLGPHWNFHNRPRNHDTHRGPSHSALNSTRSVGLRNLPAAPSVAQAPPSRPLLERVSSFTTGHNGSIRQSQPSLAARMSPVRPMRNIHVSHGLLKRTPLSFATGPATRLGPGDVDGPPKLTGSNQVPVLNLNPGIMGISTAARAGYPGSGGV